MSLSLSFSLLVLSHTHTFVSEREASELRESLECLTRNHVLRHNLDVRARGLGLDEL